jgi:hypothetical protein
MSRLGLLFVAVLFVILGGFAALLVNDIRSDDPANQTPTTSTTPNAVNRGGGSQVTTTTG